MYVSVDYGAQELEVWRLRHRPGDGPVIEGGPVAVTPAEPLECELRDFVGALRAGGTPRVNGDAGWAALELATRVARAIEVG
jgi:predicted dehydrogenase